MIIEYLTTQKDAVNDERAMFTVDTTGPVDVALYGPGGVLVSYLRNGAGNKHFQPDDNVRLLSFGIVLPYQFSFSTRAARISGFWVDELGFIGGHYGPIVELTGGAPGRIEVPFDGAEFPLDVTIPHQSTGKKVAFVFLPVEPGVGGAWELTRISMINAPVSLNTIVLRATIFAKVVHTLAMVA